MILMDLLASDRLGRRVRSRTKAEKAQRSGRVHPNEFNPPKGRNDISVDHFSDASEDQIRAIAEIAYTEFKGKFYGWYVLTVRDVERAACSVQLSPTDSNPHHADILCPEAEAVEETHRFRHLAYRLAAAARFTPWTCGNQEAAGGQAHR